MIGRVFVAASMVAVALFGGLMPVAAAEPPTTPTELPCEPPAGFAHCLRVAVYIDAATTTVWPLVASITEMPVYFPDFDYAATAMSTFRPGVTYAVTYKPFDVTGVYEIVAVEPGREMAGKQVSTGPLPAFGYVHRFVPHRGGTVSDEVVYYTLPFGIIGKLADRFVVRRRLRDVLVTAHAILKRRAESVAPQPSPR